MTSYAGPLRDNLLRIRDRIGRALEREGRAAGSARLVCVTKAFSAQAVRALLEAGATDLGENRVPKLAGRVAIAQEAGCSPRWHMVGHLQRNKARAFLRATAAPGVPGPHARALLHSLDSEALLNVFSRREELAPPAPPLEVLVEVNVGREPQKGGLAPEEVSGFLDAVAASSRVRAVGFMTMTPLGASEERAREVFRSLRALRDEFSPRYPALTELSMGMSADFEWACEEGATIVRVGRALLEGLPDAAWGAAPATAGGA
ncbi:MAG: YggS family pyridoxal phosphate-dependent enzyme [Planctomycetota bacterium]|jgi:pyridoxal phosphate enzyme (YggS family)